MFNKVATDSQRWDVLNRMLAWKAAVSHLKRLPEGDVTHLGSLCDFTKGQQP